MIDSNNSIFEYATSYHNKGYSIIPLIGKRPGVSSWQKNQSSTATMEEVRSWFSETNDYNIGIITGKISKIICLDIDGNDAEKHFDNIIDLIDDKEIQNAINNTIQIRTGGGNLHVVVGFNPQEFSDDELIKSPVLWRYNGSEHSEIRVKGEGGYFVAPPSLHPNGKRYEFINDTSPIILSKDKILMLIESLGQKDTKNNQIVHHNDLAESTIHEIVSKLIPYYKKGQRNDFILCLCGWLRKENVSLSSAKKLVKALAQDDEQMKDRLRTLNDTFEKDDLTKIKGYSGLLSLIIETDTTEKEALKVLSSVELLISQNKGGEKGKKKKITNKSNEENNQSNISEAQLVLLLAQQNCIEYFTDQYADSYVSARIDDHTELINMKSAKMRHWLYRLCFNDCKIIPSGDSITNALNVLRSEAVFGHNKKVLFLRVGNNIDNSKWFYDLSNGNWECVEISPSGWNIVKDKVLFKRYSNQETQVYPERDYEENVFEKFIDLLNIKDSQIRLLLKCYIVCLFIPNIPKPVLILHGEQGSAKTTFQELIKMLVDPSKIKTLIFPREIKELVQKLDHNYVSYFDNVSALSTWISDELCRAVTGGGFSKRQLYTDDDDIIYNFKRCIGLNGINIAATRPDLLDRSIIVQLERIPKEKRSKNEEIWNEFERLKPRVLGYILDIIVKVLQLKNNGIKVELNGLPRLADFAEYAELISRCMGNPDNAFLTAYYNNINLQTEQVLESSPIATALVHLMGTQGEWNGSASDLLSELEKIAVSLKIDIRNGKSWPKQPNYLSRRLAEIRSNLREIGIIVDWDRDPKKNTRIIKIRNLQIKSDDNVLKVENDESETKEESSNENSSISSIKNNSVTVGSPIRRFIQVDTKYRPFKNKYVAIDFEWSDENSQRKIYAAAFVGSNGNKKVFHISDFSSEIEFLNKINYELMKYPCSIGWATTCVEYYKNENYTGVDSDLVILNDRCLKNGIKSAIRFNDRSIPFIEGHTHIDLYKVFRNEVIKTSIFKNKYRSLKLDDVSMVLLGKGKISDITGQNVQSRSIKEQKDYVCTDAELVMELSRIKNGEILELVCSLAETTDLPLEEICHNTISSWWSKVFENTGFVTTAYFNSSPDMTKQHYKYEGGIVIEPKEGLYHDIKLVDVISLYPSVAMLYNISFDTVNCKCCAFKSDARVPVEVLNNGYWICKERKGIFPIKLEEFKAARLRAKDEGNEIRQLGLKILINGGYGLFGNPGFKFSDVRVAELITAYGRHILKRMQQISESHGFTVVAGDTDSLFLFGKRDISKFIQKCKDELKVDVENSMTFSKVIIVKKKHYVGITDKGDIIIKGMEGVKSDRPPWINDVFNQFVKDLFEKNGEVDPLVNLERAFQQLEEGKVNHNDLKISVRLSKDPEQYAINSPQKKIGVLLNSKEGSVIQYYLSDNGDGVSLKTDDISIRKYKLRLWNTLEDVIQLAGYNVDALRLKYKIT